MNQVQPISDAGMKYLVTDKEYFDATLMDVIKDGDIITHLKTNIGTIPCPFNPSITPQVGDTVRFYGKGLACPIRGLAIINNLNKKTQTTSIFFYRTPDEQEIWYNTCLQELEKLDIAEFEKNKDQMDKDFDALPDAFKKRVQKFRDNNPKFRYLYEYYEMVACTDAVKIAEKFKTIDAIDNFRQLPVDAQNILIPLHTERSKYTFLCSIALAKAYITNPESIIDMHGAMAIITGCNAYGCHNEEENEKS